MLKSIEITTYYQAHTIEIKHFAQYISFKNRYNVEKHIQVNRPYACRHIKQTKTNDGKKKEEQKES